MTAPIRTRSDRGPVGDDPTARVAVFPEEGAPKIRELARGLWAHVRSADEPERRKRILYASTSACPAVPGSSRPAEDVAQLDETRSRELQTGGEAR